MHNIKTKSFELYQIIKSFFTTKPGMLLGYLLLSWLYALCSQIIIPLPFNFVPISLQPAPLLLAAFFLGWHAVNAYALYLMQGACGLPFFAGLQGGFLRLMGPTGGYLMGFGLAMIFIAVVRNVMPKNSALNLLKILSAYGVIFSCGLFQLSFFVPANKLLSAGFYPFIIGDFIIKTGLMLTILNRYRK